MPSSAIIWVPSRASGTAQTPLENLVMPEIKQAGHSSPSTPGLLLPLWGMEVKNLLQREFCLEATYLF